MSLFRDKCYLNFVETKLMELDNYIKSNIVLPDGGFIYFPKRIKKLSKYIYETFIDSYGNKHSIHVATEESEYIFSDEDVDVNFIDNRLRITHKPTLMTCRDLQFNLDKYYVFDNSYESDYQFTKGFFDYNEEPIWFDVNLMYGKHEKSGYYPIMENCSNICGNNWSIVNYIPDRIFFNYPNRIYAIDRICDYSKKIFLDIDYVNMTDNELVKFMNDRFKKRIEFENLLKN